VVGTGTGPELATGSTVTAVVRRQRICGGPARLFSSQSGGALVLLSVRPLSLTDRTKQIRHRLTEERVDWSSRGKRLLPARRSRRARDWRPSRGSAERSYAPATIRRSPGTPSTGWLTATNPSLVGSGPRLRREDADHRKDLRYAEGRVHWAPRSSASLWPLRRHFLSRCLRVPASSRPSATTPTNRNAPEVQRHATGRTRTA
jgi:hypothetical protein